MRERFSDGKALPHVIQAFDPEPDFDDVVHALFLLRHPTSQCLSTYSAFGKHDLRLNSSARSGFAVAPPDHVGALVDLLSMNQK
jgi:hypothetical protein